MTQKRSTFSSESRRPSVSWKDVGNVRGTVQNCSVYEAEGTSVQPAGDKEQEHRHAGPESADWLLPSGRRERAASGHRDEVPQRNGRCGNTPDNAHNQDLHQPKQNSQHVEPPRTEVVVETEEEQK